MRATTLVHAIAAVVVTVGCRSRSADFTAQDEATIRGMFDARVADIRAGDWVKWASQHAEDCIVQPANAPTIKGRAALLAWGRSFPPIDSFSLADIQVWGEANVAYATSAYTLKLRNLPVDKGKELFVFRRPPGGQWQVVAFSLSSDLPPQAPASAPPLPKEPS